MMDINTWGNIINVGIDAVLLGSFLAAARLHFAKFKEMEVQLLHFTTYKFVDKRIEEKLSPLYERLELVSKVLDQITQVTLNKNKI